MHIATPGTVPPSPEILQSAEWLQWLSEQTGLRQIRIPNEADDRDQTGFIGTILVDRKGRIRQPRFSPYVPFTFGLKSGTPPQINRRWVKVGGMLANEIVDRGIVGSIALPPGSLDARPFQWAGLNVQIRYTFAAPLPLELSHIDNSVRKRMRKAQRLGYEASRSRDWPAIVACLRETEAAKGFDHRLSADALARAHSLMGDEAFRGYVVRSSSGTVVSGGVRLHQSNSVAVDWIQGSTREHLSDGINQLMYSYVFDDLVRAGATYFDYGGANLPSVAAAKAGWGLPLTPYLVLSGFDGRNAFRTAKATKNWVFRSWHPDRGLH